jgi:hypothetical protein
MDKETWEMDDYRKMASMVSVYGWAVDEQPLTGTLKRPYSKKQNANESLDDYAKTIRPENLAQEKI